MNKRISELFLDHGSMYSIDDLVLVYYDKSPELESCMLADRIYFYTTK